MLCFTDLPNELYIEILQYLPPPELGSFFCVNKNLYALTAAHRIRHQQLKRMFSTTLNTKQPGSTAKLIKSILANPKIALYVQHYTIDGLREGWGWADEDSVDNDGEEHVEYAASDMAQLELAVRASEFVPVDEIEEWIMGLKEGEEWVLIALALTLFPNLTSIDFQNSLDILLLDETIRRIANAKHPGGPLAKLICVNIGASESDSFIDPDAIAVFAKLPSVKIINAEKIYGHTVRLDHIVPTIGSNVTNLNVSQGDIQPQQLMLLLQSFECLQSFTYWPANDIRGEQDFDAFSIVSSLLACARDSLRELQIRAGSTPQKYMGCLREFHVLEHLDTDTMLLFGPLPGSVHNFQNSLPPSIREVKLHGKHFNSHALDSHLPSLIQSRELLPNLSSIELFQTKTFGNKAARFQAMCAMVNISLTFVDRWPISSPTLTRHWGHYAERHPRKALTQHEVL